MRGRFEPYSAHQKYLFDIAMYISPEQEEMLRVVNFVDSMPIVDKESNGNDHLPFLRRNQDDVSTYFTSYFCVETSHRQFSDNIGPFTYKGYFYELITSYNPTEVFGEKTLVEYGVEQYGYDLPENDLELFVKIDT